MTDEPNMIEWSGLDLGWETDRCALAGWRDGFRFVHLLPEGAQVTFHGDQIIVVAPSCAPYTVDPETGATTPIPMGTA